MSALLSASEIKTLLDMARACETEIDAQDTVDLYSKLPTELKPQLREALKSLPVEVKRLLSDAGRSQQGRAA